MFDSISVSLIGRDALTSVLHGIADAADEAGEEAFQASRQTSAFEEALEETTKDAVSAVAGNRKAAQAMLEAAEAAGRGDEQVTDLNASLRGLPEREEIDVDLTGTKEARAAIESLDSEEADVDVDLDLEGFITTVTQLESLDEKEVSPEVHLRGHDEVRAALQRISSLNQDPEVDLKVESKEINEAFRKLENLSKKRYTPKAVLELLGEEKVQAAVERIDEEKATVDVDYDKPTTAPIQDAVDDVNDVADDSDTDIDTEVNGLSDIQDASDSVEYFNTSWKNTKDSVEEATDDVEDFADTGTGDLNQGLDEAAYNFSMMSEEAEGMFDDMDASEAFKVDDTDDIENAMEDVAGEETKDVEVETSGMAEARAKAETVEDGVEDIGDEALESSAKVGILQGTLSGLSISQGLSDARDKLSGLHGSSQIASQLPDNLDAIPDKATAAASNTAALQVSLRSARKEADEFTDRILNLGEAERQQASEAIKMSDTTDQLSNRLRKMGDSGEKLADDLDNMDVATQGLIESSMEGSAGLRTMRGDLDETGRDSVKAAKEINQLEGQMGQLLDEAIELAVSTEMVEENIDDVGDEALQTAAEMEAMEMAMKDAKGFSTGLSTSLGPLRGSLGTVLVLAAAIVPPLFAMAAAMGAAAVAALGLAAGIGAIAFGGFLLQGEQVASTTEDIEGAMEGMQEILGNVIDALIEAVEPLKTMANIEFAMQGLRGLVTWVELASKAFQDMRDIIVPVAEAFGSSILQQTPAMFKEIGKTVDSLTSEGEWFAQVMADIPPMIAWFREQAELIGPTLDAFITSIIRVTRQMTEFGGKVFNAVIPALNIFLGFMTWTLDVLADLPQALYTGAVAFGVAAGVAYLYAGAATEAAFATWALNSALAVLTLPISGTAAAIAALIGALAAVLAHFGFFEGLVNASLGAWNALIGAIQWGINTFLGLYNALGLVGEALFFPVTVIFALIEAVKLAGRILGWLGKQLGKIIGGIVSWFGDVAAKIEEYIGWIAEAYDAIPGLGDDDGPGESGLGGSGMGQVDLSSMKAGGDGSDNKGEGTPGGPAGRRGPQNIKNETNHNYDFTGADFGGTDETEIEERVRKALEEANQESRAREEGSGY